MIGSKFKRVNVEEIHSLVAPWPPASEQAEIAAFLDGKLEHFNTLAAEAQLAVPLLQERSIALISAAVSGQIDVRHLAENKIAA